MSLQKAIPACCLILLIIFLSSCSDNTVSTGRNINILDTSSFTYPLKDGDSWNYTRKYTAQNIRPDSIKKYFSDFPIYGSGTALILYDTLLNGDTVKCLFNRYTEDSSHFESREYYKNTESGLLCYGYRSDLGTYLTPFKLNNGIHIQFDGKEFASVIQLLNYAENNIQLSMSPRDTLILEIPPVVCLKYPVQTGTKWLFKNIGYGDIIYKEYLGFELFPYGTSFYSCIKTQRIWNNFPDLVLNDYYSKMGILKRDYLVNNVPVSNEFGTIGYVDLRDFYQVTSFNLP